MHIPLLDKPPENPSAETFAVFPKALENLGRLIEGNGVGKGQLRAAKEETNVYLLQGDVRVTLIPEITHEQLKGKRSVGETAASKQDAFGKAEMASLDALKAEKFYAFVSEWMEKDDGGGWAVEDRKVPLKSLLHKEYSVVDKCLKCGGNAHIACALCNATGRIPCTACQGMGKSPCLRCHSTGLYTQTDGSRIPCITCQGRGGMICSMCQGQKNITCASCTGHMQSPCLECDQSGFWTHVYRADYAAQFHFSLNRQAADPAVIEVAEKIGLRALAVQGHGDFFRLTHGFDNTGLHVPLFCFLGIATGEFSIEGRFYPAVAAGMKGHVIEVGPVLDPLIKPGINALLKLSKGPMAAESLIRTACKYKVLRETLAGLAHHSKKQVYATLKKNYPLVLSDQYAKACVKYASLALLAISKGPRQKGLMTGAALSLLFSAGYYIGPLRQGLLTLLQVQGLGRHVLIADIFVWIGGYALSLFLIKSLAGKRLDMMVPQDGKDKGLPDAGDEGLYALGVTFLIWLACAFASKTQPHWLASVLQAF